MMEVADSVSVLCHPAGEPGRQSREMGEEETTVDLRTFAATTS
ncbi:hypothetical protein FQN60_015554, partial [Etheostoma spectabile]